MQSDLFDLTEKFDFDSGDISPKFATRLAEIGVMACDLETSGLDWKSERIGLVQLYAPGFDVIVLKPLQNKPPKRLVGLIENENVQKIFHHAMFDLRFMAHHWHVKPQNIVCTKIASKIVEPERESHSLVDLLQDHLVIAVDKSVQKSNWLSWDLSELQLAYAKSDVAHLSRLFKILTVRLEELGRLDLAETCFAHIPTRLKLEIEGYGDVFSY